MNIKIFRHDNEEEFVWLRESSIESAIHRGGTFVNFDNIVFTVDGDEATATHPDGTIEWCNFVTQMWGYEFRGTTIDRQWLWFDNFKRAAQSRRIDMMQGVDCGPIVEGWG